MEQTSRTQKSSPLTPVDEAFIPAPRRRSWRRRIILAALLAAAGGGGYALYSYLGAPSRTPVSYQTQAVVRGKVESQVTATGTLSALVTVQVGSQVSGTVNELLADYNSEVSKGQVIARIDPRQLATEVTRARANLASARAGLQKAQATAQEARLQYERDRGLAQQKIVATADVQTRLATYKSAAAQVAAARASVSQARAALATARVKLAYTTIVSPIDGIVVSRSVDVGQTVAASLSAPTLFTIAGDLRQMEVHTSVAESDVGQLKPGMAVRFSVDAYPGEAFAGVVKQVRYEAQTVQNVVTYDAVISVRNDELKLRPGMTTNVTFIVAAADRALLVPSAALRFRPPGARRPQKPASGTRPTAAGRQPTAAGRQPAAAGKRSGRLVWVLGADGAPTSVRIRPGISDGNNTQVLDGELEPGDRVIVGQQGDAGGNQAAGAGSPASKRRGPAGRRIL
jgi:HlyD family secretion protein